MPPRNSHGPKLAQEIGLQLRVVLIEADESVRLDHLIRDLLGMGPRAVVESGRRPVRHVDVSASCSSFILRDRRVEPELVPDDAAAELAAVAVARDEAAAAA